MIGPRTVSAVSLAMFTIWTASIEISVVSVVFVFSPFFIRRANAIGTGPHLSTGPHGWIGGSTFDFEDGSEEGEDNNTADELPGLATG